jgi:hypothetical protein
VEGKEPQRKLSIQVNTIPSEEEKIDEKIL